MAGSGPKQLTILHLNDIYDINPRASGQEPVGGASRMASKLKSFGPEALVLFSGDALNPSLLSTVTQGKQMVEVLNEFNVKAACVGNHDFVTSAVRIGTQLPWLAVVTGGHDFSRRTELDNVAGPRPVAARGLLLSNGCAVIRGLPEVLEDCGVDTSSSSLYQLSRPMVQRL
ncbi:hypothetical protein ABPG75_012182 [Micractinium tetrahymenae]